MVVCKATYLLRPGESPLAPEQDALNEYDSHWEYDARRSLHAAADVVPLKRSAEVMLSGHAFSPGKQPARSIVARLVVAEVEKVIEVCGDRFFGQDGALHQGAPFTRMPLLYERAAGGPGTANPVGVRRDGRDAFGKIALPNLQLPGTHVSSPDDVIDPIGFGPIAPSWPERVEKLGRSAATWSHDQWRRAPLPEDIDFGYFNAAPRDQQLSALREDERIVLENLHPDHARLVTNLAGIRPRAVVNARGAVFGMPLRGDTLWIDTDRAVCTLTWRGQFALQHPNETGQVTVTLEQAGASPEARPGHTLVGSRSADESPTKTLVGDQRGWGSALPFARSDSTNRRDEGPPRSNVAMPFAMSLGGERPSTPATLPTPPALPDDAVPWPQTPAPIPAPVPMAYSPSPPAAVESSPWAAGPPREIAVPATIGAAVVAASSVAVIAPPDPKDGALAASNAAAGSASVTPAVRAEPLRAAPAQPAARPATRVDQREVLRIIWFDPESMPRIRRKASWRAILDAIEDAGQTDPEGDDPSYAKDPSDAEDRRDVFAILAQGDPIEGDGLNEALAAGVRDDGRYLPALELVSGELLFPFDELETLKATLTTVSPLVGNDENLKGALDAAKEFLKTPELRSAPAVADGLTTRIRDAFAQGRRTVPASYLDAQTERVLLDQRCYQKRAVFGAPHLRALLQTAGSPAPVPTYLPESLAKKLPLYQRFRARLITQVELAVDQYESHPAALQVAALGRLAPAPGRK